MSKFAWFAGTLGSKDPESPWEPPANQRRGKFSCVQFVTTKTVGRRRSLLP